MPSPSRTNRFQSFTPLRSTTTSTSLRRLRTAFSPNRSMRSASPSSSTSTETTSPLTRNSSPHSYRSSAASIRHMLSIRRKPSVLEFEIEEEKHLFEQELDLLEPRPAVGFGAMGPGEVHVVGIFEVLDGKC